MIGMARPCRLTNTARSGGFDMKKWDGVESPSTYIFSAFCFYFGLFLLTALTIGQVKVDYSEGPGWSPFSRLPDGSPALSEFTVGTLGFMVLFAVGSFLVWAIKQ
jgi:hypothetical protein